MLVIYGRSHPICPFCIQAKKIAEKAGLAFEYKDITEDEWSIEEVTSLLGFAPKTVPIVVDNGQYLGGAKELAEMVRSLNK